MRIIVTIDDDLYEKARKLSELSLENTSDLVHESIATYVRVQEAQRLAALGAQAPEMQKAGGDHHVYVHGTFNQPIAPIYFEGASV